MGLIRVINMNNLGKWRKNAVPFSCIKKMAEKA